MTFSRVIVGRLESRRSFALRRLAEQTASSERRVVLDVAGSDAGWFWSRSSTLTNSLQPLRHAQQRSGWAAGTCTRFLEDDLAHGGHLDGFGRACAAARQAAAARVARFALSRPRCRGDAGRGP